MTARIPSIVVRRARLGRWTGSVLALTVAAASAGALTAAPAALAGTGRVRTAAGPTCTDSWKTAVSGAWTDGTKWSTGAAPASADNACITVAGTYTVTLLGGASATALTLGGSSGSQTLIVSGQGQDSSLTLSAATGSDIGTHGILVLDAPPDNGNAILAGGSGVTLTNDGTVRTLDATTRGDYLRVNLTNDAGGSVSVAGAATIQDQGTTTVDNGTFATTSSGTLTVSGSSLFTHSGGALSNGGTLVQTSGTFTQSGGNESGNPVQINNATLTDSAGSGAFTLFNSDNLNGTIPAGQSVDVLGGGGNSDAGATLANPLTNNGTLTLDSEGAHATVAGSTITNNGTFDTLGGGSRNCYIRSNLTNTATGTVSLACISTIQDQGTTTVNNGTFAISSGATLTVSGNSLFTDSAGTLANGGTLAQTSGTFTQSGGNESGNPVQINNATLTDSAGSGAFTLFNSDNLNGTIPAGQSVDVLGGGGNSDAGATLANPLTNNGTLTLDSEGAHATVAGSTITNNGTFDTLGGGSRNCYIRSNLTNTATGTVSLACISTIQDQGTTTVNNGTFAISSGATLTVSGNSLFTDSAGTLANGGTLAQTSGTFTQSGGNESGNPVQINNATLTDSAGSGAFTLFNSDNLNGTIPAGQSVDVLGGGGNSDAGATLANPLTNNGTLTLDSEGAHATVAGSTITNNGTFDTLGGGSRNCYIRSNLTNNGTATLGCVNNLQDQGTTTVNNGTLAVTDGATLGLAGGSVLTETAGSTFQPTVDASNGAYGVTGGTVSLAGTLAITTVGRPTTGQVFGVISGSTVTGSFSGESFGPHAYVIAVSPSGVTATTAVPFTLTGKNVKAYEDLPFTKVAVATVAAGSQAGPTYTASINWGDGTAASAGAVSGKNLTGSHQYTAIGSYTITTTLSDQFGTTETVTSTATVVVPPAPSLSKVKPGSVTTGTTATLTLTGKNLTTNSAVAFSNPGITVTSVTWKSATSLSVKVAVAAGSTAGAGNVTVTTPGGAGTCTGCVTVIVTPSKPTIKSVKGTLTPGATSTVTVTGTEFVNGLTVTTNIAGATVGPVTGLTATSFSISITTPAATAAGKKYVLTVANPDGGTASYSKLTVS